MSGRGLVWGACSGAGSADASEYDQEDSYQGPDSGGARLRMVNPIRAGMAGSRLMRVPKEAAVSRGRASSPG